MTATIIILAAGTSRRMRGTDKLLQRVDGVPQLRRISLAAVATGHTVIVALPKNARARQEALAELAVQIVIVEGAEEGVSASIRVAAKAAGRSCPVVIVPADMPDLDRADILAVLAAHEADQTAVLRGSTGTVPGHPVLFPTDLVPALQEMTGDEGARRLIAAHAERLKLVPLPGEHATLDLDTPEDWEAWSQQRRMRTMHAPWTADRALLDPLDAALQNPNDVVLAVITGVIGASYRNRGTMMAFFPDGSSAGDLTNGCIEGDVALHAAQSRESGKIAHLRYGVNSPYMDIRLPCGGGLEIGLFPQPGAAMLAEIAGRRMRREYFSLCFTADGGLRLQGRKVTGWLGSDFVVEVIPEIAFMIFGEGSEAIVFARLVHAANYPHCLVTASAKTLEAAQASGCKAILDAGRAPGEVVKFDARTAVVTFFHDHDREIPILSSALSTEAFYVGSQGSSRVAGQRYNQLLAAGIAPESLAKLRAPIGIIPSARDPRTLAVSVLAEVIALSERHGA